MIWLRKLAALFLLSFGAGLAFLPFPDHLAGERTDELVQLEVRPAPSTRESARARFGDSFIELSYEGMDRFPEVREAVLSLMGQSSSRCVPSGEWHALLADRSIADPEGMAYAFRDDLHRISSVKLGDPEVEGGLVCFEAAMLGAYDDPEWGGLDHLAAADLEGYPELKAELERLAAGPVPAESRRSISQSLWRRFQRRELDDSGYRPYFVVLDRLYSGAVENEVVPWSLQTPWLGRVAGAVGAAAVLLGLVMAVASYRAASVRPGLAVASPWLTVFCDLISLAGGLIFGVLAIDTLWVGPIGQPSLLGLHPEWPSPQPITGLHFVSVLVILIALPALTLWFTSLSAQRIEVDAERLTSHGALGSRSIPWQGLERVQLRAQRNPFAFSVVDFRRLQKVMDLEGAEHSVTINEPGSWQRKKAILDALRQYAPEAKRGLFTVVEREW